MEQNKFETVDITECEKEPIHILGKIQGAGFLIVINQTNRQIEQVSENIVNFLDLSAQDLVGTHINKTQIMGLVELIQAYIYAREAVQSNPPVVKLPNNQSFNLLIHEWQHFYILEFDFLWGGSSAFLKRCPDEPEFWYPEQPRKGD